MFHQSNLPTCALHIQCHVHCTVKYMSLVHENTDKILTLSCLKFLSFSVVSLALKLHEKRMTVTQSTVNIWQDILLKYSSRVLLDIETIREVKKGLELGRLLKLPADLTFNYPRMSEFLAGGNIMRPLSHVE